MYWNSITYIIFKTEEKKHTKDLREKAYKINTITQFKKVKNNKWDYIKLKSFCTAKEAINKTNH